MTFQDPLPDPDEDSSGYSLFNIVLHSPGVFSSLGRESTVGPLVATELATMTLERPLPNQGSAIVTASLQADSMEIQTQRVFDIPASEVWEVVGEQFGDLSWSDSITSSHLEGELGVGAVRVCLFPPNQFSKEGLIKERLLSFDREKMAISYEALGLNGVMKAATNRWTVVPTGAQSCRIDMHASVEMSGLMGMIAPLFGFMLKRMGRATLDQLAVRLELHAQTRAPGPLSAGLQ